MASAEERARSKRLRKAAAPWWRNASHVERPSRRQYTKRILFQKTQTQRAFPEAAAKPVMVYCRPPDYTARDGLTSRMVRNHGAGLLEDSPARASAEPQVRPLAPCFTARSQGRDMSPNIRPMFLGAPDFLSCTHADDTLESRRAHPAFLTGVAETHLPPNRPQITALGPT